MAKKLNNNETNNATTQTSENENPLNPPNPETPNESNGSNETTETPSKTRKAKEPRQQILAEAGGVTLRYVPVSSSVGRKSTPILAGLSLHVSEGLAEQYAASGQNWPEFLLAMIQRSAVNWVDDLADIAAELPPLPEKAPTIGAKRGRKPGSVKTQSPLPSIDDMREAFKVFKSGDIFLSAGALHLYQEDPSNQEAQKTLRKLLTRAQEIKEGTAAKRGRPAKLVPAA